MSKEQVMHEELKQLGVIIRQEREKKNLTLKEIENATSVRIVYLEAIENGHFGKLISSFYAQGFLRKYVTFLNMNPDSLLEQFPNAKKILQHVSDQPQEFSYGIGSLEKRTSSKGELKSMSHLVWVGAGAIVVLFVWWIIKHFNWF